VIVQDRILQGPGAALLTIDAHQATRIFRTRGTTTIAGMTITGGFANSLPGGGGILNEYVPGGSNLTVADSVVTGNTAGVEFGGYILGMSGGGIHAGGGGGAYNALKVVNSTISNNTALWDFGADINDGNGGGIFGGYSDVTVDR
jgi:hypothetical protein